MALFCTVTGCLIVLCEVAFVVTSVKEVLSWNLIRNIYFTKLHSLLRFAVLFWGGAGCELRVGAGCELRGVQGVN